MLGQPARRLGQAKLRHDGHDEGDAADHKGSPPAQVRPEPGDQAQANQGRQEQPPGEGALVEHHDRAAALPAYVLVEERGREGYLGAEAEALQESGGQKALKVPGEGGEETEQAENRQRDHKGRLPSQAFAQVAEGDRADELANIGGADQQPGVGEADIQTRKDDGQRDRDRE